jgi:hypothetical protein
MEAGFYVTMGGPESGALATTEQTSATEASACSEPYWNPLRRELEAWLGRYSPDLVDIYRGALKILFDSEFPARLRFVSHAVREIRNRVPDAITGTRPKRVEYVNDCDRILARWRRAGLPLDGTIPAVVIVTGGASTARVEVPKPIYSQIADLLREHSDARETKRQRAQRMYQALNPTEISTSEVPSVVVHEWFEATEWAVERVHLPIPSRASEDTEAASVEEESFASTGEGAPSIVSEDQLQPRFELFEHALGALIRTFFATTQELDEILQEANS